MSNQQWTPGQEWQRPADPATPQPPAASPAGQQPPGVPGAQPQPWEPAPQRGHQPQDASWPQPPQPWEHASQDAPQLWAQAPTPSKPSPFDFGFKALSLPGSAGLIFLLGTIGLGLEWLFGVITILASGSEYILVSPISVLQAIVGGAGALLVKVLALRVLIEIGVAVTTLLTRQKNGSSES